MRSDSALPHFIDLELKADGWIKKYVLHYELPDGTRYEYDSASRKGPDAYRAELEANGRGETPRADADGSPGAHRDTYYAGVFCLYD